MATLLISEKRPRIVNRMTSVMLTLTEREDDAALLKDAKAFRTAIGNASEQVTPSSLNRNVKNGRGRFSFFCRSKASKLRSKQDSWLNAERFQGFRPFITNYLMYERHCRINIFYLQAFPPVLIHNLLTLASRIQVSSES